jgi:hypothetical protein
MISFSINWNSGVVKTTIPDRFIDGFDDAVFDCTIEDIGLLIDLY